MAPQDRLIVALDVPTRADADALATSLDDEVRWFKIGLELYSSEGPELVRDFVRAGRRVFVDLKLHDIPATVGRATTRLAGLGAGLLSLHAAGGKAMMEAAVKAAAEGAGDGERLKILAVTVLTSLEQSDLGDVGIHKPIRELVVQRAQLAATAGCDGVVASPHEAAALREALPEDFLIVTPGVRPEGADFGDQKRVMTPGQARAAGADMIVVGRPVRDAESPLAAAKAIAGELRV
ncbi:MAG: orotidine-5'-phosphate decarboxylase [Myxococcales bacterium]|nr:orotidine-5'-phosphate decarboxylase [Myxococcales bacterium]